MCVSYRIISRSIDSLLGLWFQPEAHSVPAYLEISFEIYVYPTLENVFKATNTRGLCPEGVTEADVETMSWAHFLQPWQFQL
mgnify:CR=1 FL=1